MIRFLALTAATVFITSTVLALALGVSIYAVADMWAGIFNVVMP